MFKNYLLVAWRNLSRRIGLSFISIFGLALGIACFSFFLLYALNEFSFDGFHQHSSDIYRVYRGTSVWQGSEQQGGIFTPMPLGPTMKHDFPDVVEYVRYIQSVDTYLKIGNVPEREDLAFVDPSFFSVFSFKLRSGAPQSALADLHSIVLTESTAKRLFGMTDVIGKSVQLKVLDNNFENFTVTAVEEDLPSNSSFRFSMLVNFNYIMTTTEGRACVDNWRASAFQTFVQLRPGSRLPTDQRRLTAFLDLYNPGQKKGGSEHPLLYGLEPLKQIHTDLGLGNMNVIKVPPVDPFYIWILLGIAAGVLLIACVNFTTLAVGRSANRAKEIGVRKVIGGSEGSLRWQFIIETYLHTFIAAVFGILLTILFLPYFNEMAGRTLHFSFEQYPLLPWLFALLLLCVGLFAGAYPAVILSRCKPVEVLKAKIRLGGSNGFTKALVTFQFVLSIGLIIAAVVIMQQLDFLHSKNPGFQKENVVVVKALNIPDTKKLYSLFREDLATRPQIVNIASTDYGFGLHEGTSTEDYEYDGRTMTVFKFGVDPNFLRVLGMQLVAGRNFDVTTSADTLRSVIINETMMKTLGWTLDNAIGQHLKNMKSGDTASAPVVIGVVKDVNFMSMDAQVEPQLFHQFPETQPYHFYVRIRPGDPAVALTAIGKSWKEVAPDYPFEYNFLEEDLDAFYTADIRLSHIVGWAGGISIFLACLGLLGLAALAAVNRTKEIGIRKLLGASVFTIVGLICRDFVRLVGLAFLIAAPTAWYCMTVWLQGFYYHIVLEWWVFAIVGILIVGAAWLTVAGLAAKAGMANPVKSLRTDG